METSTLTPTIPTPKDSVSGGVNDNTGRDKAGFDQEYPHLYVETAAQLKRSVDERVKFTYQDKFILHASAREVLTAMKEIYNRPPGLVRPACLGVIGNSNAGKTATAQRFFRDLGGDPAKFFGNHDTMPVVLVEMPPRATEPRVCLAVARALGLTGYGAAKARVVTDNVYRALIAKKVRVLILMEFQHVVPLPSCERQIVFDLVKGISNHGISVIGVGTDEAHRMIKEDVQIANRMRIIRLRGFAKGQEFQNFLHSLEPFYPLPQSSGLASPELSEEIYSRTGGVTGEVVSLCNAAAAFAIKEECPSINRSVLRNTIVYPAADKSA